MKELLENKLRNQARELISSGIVRLAMGRTDVKGDVLPKISYSNYEQMDCYFVNLGLTAVQAKFVPIGIVDSLSGQIVNKYEPFDDTHVNTAVMLTNDLQEFCNINNITYDIEFGRLR